MNPCDHMPSPGERNADGDCIHCLRDAERERREAGNPAEISVLHSHVGHHAATLKDWLKQPGDRVDEGEPVVLLDVAPGRTVAVVAKMTGTLGIHRLRPGSSVRADMVLGKLSPTRDVPAAELAALTPAEPEPADTVEEVAETEFEEETVAEVEPEQGPQPGPEFILQAEPSPDESAETPGEASEDEEIISKLADLKAEGRFVVSLVGFYEGGKTWLLNRLKHELSRKGYSLLPSYARDRTQVRRTNNFSIHRFEIPNQRTKTVEQFAIIDLPGELIGQLMQNPLEGPVALLASLNVSGALIVALPADEVLLSRYATEAKQLMAEPEPRDPKQRGRRAMLSDKSADLAYVTRLDRLAIADDLLLDFTDQLCQVTALLSTVRSAGTPLEANLRESGITELAIERHVQSGAFVPFRTPTYVALTKADRVSMPDAVAVDLIGSDDAAVHRNMLRDPREMVMLHREELVAKFDHWFDQYKFDFVSAFEGHGGDAMIRYKNAHHGVWGILEWIAWCRRLEERKPSQQAAMARARRIRAMRDGIEVSVPLGIGRPVKDK